MFQALVTVGAGRDRMKNINNKMVKLGRAGAKWINGESWTWGGGYRKGG